MNSTILKKQTSTVITHTRTSQEVELQVLLVLKQLHLLPLNFFKTSQERIPSLEDPLLLDVSGAL